MTDLVAMAKELRARANSSPEKNEADFRREILARRDEDTAAIEHTEPTPAMRAGFKAIVEHDRALYGEAHVDALKAEVAALVREDFATARGYCEQYGEWCSQQVLVRRKRVEALFAGLTDEIIEDNARRAAEGRA